MQDAVARTELWFAGMLVLAGDIGGTKTELALYRLEDSPVELERARFKSADYPGLAPVALEFLRGRAVDASAFAVAGPVYDGRSKITNLPWEIDEQALGAALGSRVALLNDLEAAAHGIGELQSSELALLAEGKRDPRGPIALIAAGTGLGEAIAVPTSQGLRVLPSEGGHADFAPRNEVEDALLSFLRARHGGRVSVERAVSGIGLLAIHDFVLAQGLASGSEETRAEMLAGDGAEVIGRKGSSGQDAACERALSIFVGLYGAEAGNLALKALPTGGLFVAGGMAPKLLERLRRGDFMHALLDKGRMATLLARIPVAVVTCPHVALLGARARASMIYKNR
jgi:glucokinase